MTTLLRMLRNVADDLTVERQATVIDSTDNTARLLLVQANREGRFLIRRHNWTSLVRPHTFVTVIGTAEYPLPSDYRRLLSQTEWDRTNKRPLSGPVDVVDWEVLKSSGLGSGLIGYRFRIVRSSSTTSRMVVVDPTPTVANETLAFEYISDCFCASSGGTPQNEWLADTDVAILDPDIMELGIQVRYRRSRGMAFGSEADEYTQLVDQAVGDDMPSKVLNLNSTRPSGLLGVRNLPETGYGS